VVGTYDVVVIGSGMGGYVAAIRASQLGLKTAVVERQPVLGGTCLNWGCIPTKALLEHAHVFSLARHAADWGISGGAGASPSVDLARVHERKNAIVGGLVRGVEYLFKKNKIDWIKGTGRLAGAGSVEVNGPDAGSLAANEILIATGTAPRIPEGITLDRRRILTSDEAMSLEELPRSIAILGSGAVGVEFASIFRQFGSDVTLIEVQPRLVPSEDAAVSTELERVFKRRGIHVRTSTRMLSATADDRGVTVELGMARGEGATLAVDILLVAVGRGAVTDGLGVEAAKLTLDRGFIAVDDHYRTSVAGIAAVGDVISIAGRQHPQLAHLASAEGILAAERIAGREIPLLNYDHVPACTFCDPEIGSVGLTEAEAAARGYDVKVGTFPFSALGRARIAGDTEGFVKVVGEAEYDQLLGVHIIGPRATDLIGEAAAALRLESTVEELIRTIHAHPTMSEAIGEAALDVSGRGINI
jgi:dihydrolipoamide dehydrogenase